MAKEISLEDLTEKNLQYLRSEAKWVRENLSEYMTRKEYKELERRLHKVELKLKIA